MNYKNFFEEHYLKLQICPALLENNFSRLIYSSENERDVIVKVPLDFKGTIYRDNLEGWLTEYPDLQEFKENLLNEEVFAIKRDGKVYPYLILKISQEIYLYLDKNRLDEIIANPSDFELDPSILSKVDFTSGEYKFEIVGSKKVAKKYQKAFEQALEFPMRNYVDMFDLLVKID